MWIAFELASPFSASLQLYLWIIENSYYQCNNTFAIVVNCFRIVSLNYWKQPSSTKYAHQACCELLSNCIFELLKTATADKKDIIDMLWIAFELYLWIIENSWSGKECLILLVVNCFRIVSLNYWKQQSRCFTRCRFRCELLSNCIFELLKTANVCGAVDTGPLWIAFELYLWIIENSLDRFFRLWLFVVNCFRIVSLNYWKQLVILTYVM